jgi:beta-glucosidase
MLGPWWGVGRDADAVSLYDGIKAQDPSTTFTPGLHDDRQGPAGPDACGRV